MRKQLTDQMIGKLRPPATGRLEIFDSIVPGMAVRLTPNGGKSFVVRCRVKGQPNAIRVTIGDARGVKLTDARREASEILKTCRAGDDPRAIREARAAEAKRHRTNTFGAVAEEFLKRHVAKLRSARFAEGVIRRELLGQVWDDEKWTDDRRKPRWRERPIAGIARRDVVALLEEIVDSGRPYSARLVLAYARKLFRWAIERDVYGLDANPCYEISAARHGAPTVPRQVTIGPDHLRLVWKAAGELGEPFGPYIKMLLLSGQRRNEIARLRWSEVDRGEKVIVLPAERMKAKRPHEVALSAPMIELLEGMTRGKGEYVFSSTDGERPIGGFAKLKTKLDKKVAELHAREMKEARANRRDVGRPKDPADWRLHDLRRTMRTGLGAIPEIAPDVRELVIAHVPPALVRNYDLYSYRTEKRHALELWAQRLLRIVERLPAAGNVVRIAR